MARAEAFRSWGAKRRLPEQPAGAGHTRACRGVMSPGGVELLLAAAVYWNRDGVKNV